MQRKHLTSLLAGASLLAVLTACSSDGGAESAAEDGNEAADSQSSTDTNTGSDADTDTDTADDDFEGAVDITVNGEEVVFHNATVSCTTHEGQFIIGAGGDLGSSDSDNYGSILSHYESVENPTPIVFEMHSYDDEYLAVSDARPDTWAEATGDGETYTVNGEAHWEGDDEEAIVPFEATLTCPSDADHLE